MLEMIMLGSGSKGNACIIKTEDTMVLIDAGLSGAQIRKRMETLGLNPDDLQTCLITHEHSDHIKGASILSQRHKVPLLMHPATYRAGKRAFQGNEQIHYFELGEIMSIGSLEIQSVPTLHDAASATGFLVRNGNVSLGYLTDLGAVAEDNFLMMRHADFLLLEANHDRDMLWNGPYPPHLKARVDSRLGHLSNTDSAEFIRLLSELGRLRGVMLAHLSENNNTPELALKTVRERQHRPLELYVALQEKPSTPIILE